MSILNVNKINPVGGGSTVTIAGIASVTSSVIAPSFVGNVTGNADTASGLSGNPSINTTGIVTATSFSGSGENLTGVSYVKILQATGTSISGNQINFDNLDVATYKSFDLIGGFRPAADATIFRMRFRTGGASGSDYTGSDYNVGFNVPYPNNNNGTTTAVSATQMQLSTTVGNHSTEGIFINMRISFADSGDSQPISYVMNNVTWNGTYREQGNGFRSVTGTGHLYTGNTYPTGFSVSFGTNTILDHSYILYGLKR